MPYLGMSPITSKEVSFTGIIVYSNRARTLKWILCFRNMRLILLFTNFHAK